MIPNMNDLMKQAQELQEKMKAAQEKRAKMLYYGEAGAGMVKVTMTGQHDVKKVAIDDSVMQEDKELLEDLLCAAVNDAVRKVEAGSKDVLAEMGAGLNMPGGFKFPF